MGSSKEKTCKFKHAAVVVFTSQSHYPEMSGKTADGITLLVVVRDNGVILVRSNLITGIRGLHKMMNQWKLCSAKFDS
jgi:hypothetical protein